MLVVFDIDGTLCFNGYSIDSVIVRALEQLKEVVMNLFSLQHDRYVIYYL